MNLKNKTELEKYFANHFDTVLFPVLADIYKTEGDLSRAKKVCEIGLEYHPNNVDGTFVLAEINLLAGDLINAEKLLKNVMAVEPLHYGAAINLAKIQLKLKRAPASIAKLWQIIAEINPTHPEAKAFLIQPISQEDEPDKEKEIAEIKKPTNKNSEVKKLKQKIGTASEIIDTPIDAPQKTAQNEENILGPKPPSIKPQKISEEELQSLDISPRMATFTMVNVLKKQKLYQQAIVVLSMLEEKGADSALINQERKNLQKLIKENEPQ
ncbi:tetratricopeptide repeat protein [Candidatus Neomarinimicrobiota bacterium]